MNRKIGTILVITILLLLTIETGSSNEIGDKSINEKEWTYIVFCGGDDLSWGFEPATDLLDYIIQKAENDSLTIFLKNKVNAVALIDWGRAFYIKMDQKGLFRAKLKVVEEYDELNFGNYTLLRDFIIQVKEECPANRYFLHMHGHGMAWFGAQPDDVPGEDGLEYDYLTMDEIHRAIEESGGVDILQFTNCNMANFESAYELRNCTDFYIASEESSAAFTPFIGILGNFKMLNRYWYRSSEFISKKIINNFKRWYPYRFTPYMFLMGGEISDHFTMSAIRTDKLDEVCQRLNDLSDMLIGNFSDFKDHIIVSRLQANDFPDYFIPIGYLVDFYHFADLLDNYVLEDFSPELYNVIQDLKSSLDESIIANWAQKSHKDAYGLSLFFPYSNDYSGYLSPPMSRWSMENYTTHKLEFTADTRWDEFLQVYLDNQ